MIDFSHFPQDVLLAIETAARLADSSHSHFVMPCHLVGGLASVNGTEVYSVLKQNGYDPDSTLEAIGNGMSQPSLETGGSGVSFHPEVEDVFLKLSSVENVSISKMMTMLISFNGSSINSYLIKANNPTKKDVAEIVEINLKKELERLRENEGILTYFDPSVVKFIVENGCQPVSGGQSVDFSIETSVVNPLLSALTNGTINVNSLIYILENNNEIVFKNVSTF